MHAPSCAVSTRQRKCDGGLVTALAVEQLEDYGTVEEGSGLEKTRETSGLDL